MLNSHVAIDPMAMEWKRDSSTTSIEGDFIFGAGIRNMKNSMSSVNAAHEPSGNPARL